MSRHTPSESEIRRVLGGCSRFRRCYYLISVLSSHRFYESWAPGVSRSQLDSAVQLSCADRNSLCHGAHRFLAIAQWFVDLSAHRLVKSKCDHVS